MPTELGQQFEQRLSAARKYLQNISEEDAGRKIQSGGWSRKEVLGHLIDSALNNHQRFVRAALDGAYEGPAYKQDGWVNIHGYHDLPWTVLPDHWSSQNELLGRVVGRIQDEKLSASCKVGDEPPVTLGFLVTDYLHHMEQHIGQITGTAEAGN